MSGRLTIAVERPTVEIRLGTIPAAAVEPVELTVVGPAGSNGSRRFDIEIAGPVGVCGYQIDHAVNLPGEASWSMQVLTGTALGGYGLSGVGAVLRAHLLTGSDGTASVRVITSVDEGVPGYVSVIPMQMTGTTASGGAAAAVEVPWP